MKVVNSRHFIFGFGFVTGGGGYFTQKFYLDFKPTHIIIRNHYMSTTRFTNQATKDWEIITNLPLENGRSILFQNREYMLQLGVGEQMKINIMNPCDLMYRLTDFNNGQLYTFRCQRVDGLNPILSSAIGLHVEFVWMEE